MELDLFISKDLRKQLTHGAELLAIGCDAMRCDAESNTIAVPLHKVCVRRLFCLSLARYMRELGLVSQLVWAARWRGRRDSPPMPAPVGRPWATHAVTRAPLSTNLHYIPKMA